MSRGMQCATAYCIIIGMIYVALHTVLSLGVHTVALYYCIMPRDTQCVTAYCIICLGVCRVITAYCVITGGRLYGTGIATVYHG